MAIRERTDLRKGQPIVKPSLELIAIHDAIVPVGTDGKANPCSRTRLGELA
jgi:hypothetical protein